MRNHTWGNIHTHIHIKGQYFQGQAGLESRTYTQGQYFQGKVTSKVTKASIPRLRVEIFLAADNLGE